jgi:hypothetical protein
MSTITTITTKTNIVPRQTTFKDKQASTKKIHKDNLKKHADVFSYND